MREGISSLILSIGKHIKAQHHPPTPSSSEDGEKQKLQGSPLPRLKSKGCQRTRISFLTAVKRKKRGVRDIPLLEERM